MELTSPGTEAALALVGAARRLGILRKVRKVWGIDRVVVRDSDATRCSPVWARTTATAVGASAGEVAQHGLTARGRATWDRIVAAAAALMHQGGVAGTSLDDVRAATGTSKSQLYHYFADKSALVRAVVERQVDQVLQA